MLKFLEIFEQKFQLLYNSMQNSTETLEIFYNPQLNEYSLW